METVCVAGIWKFHLKVLSGLALSLLQVCCGQCGLGYYSTLDKGRGCSSSETARERQICVYG